MIGIVIKATDQVNYAIISAGDTLEAMQSLVDGYIEPVHPKYLKPHQIILVDEEGALKGKPVNNTASLLCGCPILGDVLILKEGLNEDGEPDIISLESDEARLLLEDLVRRFPYLEVVA